MYGTTNCLRYPGLDAFFFQAEDGIRDLVRSRGLGDVYKRQAKALLDRVRSIEVSIHAPRCRGAMHRIKHRFVVARPVSIHAPRCRGAMPFHIDVCVEDCQFQSTPPVAEGRCLIRAAESKAASEFQSTPPVAEGRCAGPSWTSLARGISFHPRPPLPRGEARSRSMATVPQPRFNPPPT